MMVVDYHELCQFGYPFYVFVIVVLVVVLICRVNKCKNDGFLGIVTFQPSSSPIGVVMVLAKYFFNASKARRVWVFPSFIPFLLLLVRWR